MKRGKIHYSIIAILTILLLLTMVTLAGCGDKTSDKPKSVQIEAYHPQIKGKLTYAKTYYMKYDGNPKVFDIKIYCIQDKRYLTNDDLVDKDLNFLTTALVRKNEETNSTRIDIASPNEWPTEVGKYHINIDFNSMIISSQNDPNYYAAPLLYFTLFIEEENNND